MILSSLLCMVIMAVGDTTRLLVRFDGSFRSSSSLQESDGSTQCHAACAATLYKDDTLLAVGGRYVKVESSGEAEYEGLLLGLQKLHDYLSSSASSCNLSLTIQGDCKTVIHQLKGRSLARKMQAYSDTTRNLLDAIMTKIDDVNIHHIGRQHNQLCDAVANAIVQEQQRLFYLEAYEKIITASSTTDASALKEVWTSCKPHIPPSKRLLLYRFMARSSPGSLVWIGQELESEIRTRSDRLLVTDTGRDQWIAEAVWYQIVGLEEAADRQSQRRADVLRRKWRYLLQQNQSSLAELDLQAPCCENGSTMEPPAWDSSRTLPLDDWKDESVLDAWRRAAFQSPDFISHQPFWYHPKVDEKKAKYE